MAHLTYADLEYTLDGGATVQPCTAQMDNGNGSVSIPVGNENKPAGTVGVRAKARAGFTAGPWNFNAVPFTRQVTKHTVFGADAPAGALEANGAAIQLGMKFRSTQAGWALGVRFYKQAGNTGTHTGALFDYTGGGTAETGTRLAMATYTDETASGWQEVYFEEPIPIVANKTYMATMLSASGYYSATGSYFSAAKVNGILTGLANGTDGTNGNYQVRSDAGYPNNAYQASNYWVDVIFATELPGGGSTGGGGDTGGGDTGGGGGTAPRPAEDYLMFEDFETVGAINSYNMDRGDHAWAVNEVTDLARTGTRSVRMELRSTDDKSKGPRTEFSFPEETQRERWYAFSVYFPSTYNQPDDLPETLVQWHNGPDDHLGEGWRSPAKAIYIENGRLDFKIGYNTAQVNYQNNSLFEGVTHYDLGPVPHNRWVDFVFHIYHHYDSTGLVECWMDGQKVVTHNGGNSWNDVALPFWKLGIYKWAWASEGPTPGNATRVRYYDSVRRGDATHSYASMAPGGAQTGLSIDTTDPATLTGWEDQVSVTSAAAVGGVVTIKNRRFRSLNSDVPALTFGEGATTGVDIVIENCDFYGAGYLIKSWYNNNKVTIRNCRGWGAPLTAWTSYKKPRRFATINGVTELVVENCFMKGTAGIAVDTLGADIAKLHVRYNTAINIDGRVQGDVEKSQFLQIRGRGKQVLAGEVAWNYVLNEPNRSYVEDNINFYNVGGVIGNRFKVRNNFIKGAFYTPYDATSPYYSGGGIIMDSSNQEDATWGQVNTCTRFVDIEDNYVVGSNNYSFSICTGRDIAVRRNVAICKGYLDAADVARIGGTGRLTGDPSGNNVRDFYAAGVISNIVVDSNRVGVFKWDTGTSQYVRRTGYFTDAGVSETNRINIASPINEAAEEVIYQEWLNKVKAAGLVVGKLG